jgi:hypothetical protein
MRQRGRRSSAETSTLIVDASRQAPPEAPSDLTNEQAQVWREVVGSLPRNWLLRGAQPILVAYCRHVCRSRSMELQIAQFGLEWRQTGGDLERLDRLLALSEKETRLTLACARALRLTPQAQMHPRTAGRAISNLPQGLRPWET